MAAGDRYKRRHVVKDMFHFGEKIWHIWCVHGQRCCLKVFVQDLIETDGPSAHAKPQNCSYAMLDCTQRLMGFACFALLALLACLLS